MGDGSCSCGGGQKNKVERIIFPCAGACNVGQISNEAAIDLENEGYANYLCTAALALPTMSILSRARGADKVIVVDGCKVACARRIAEKSGIFPDQHLVITDLGIKKAGREGRSENDVEDVVIAILDGSGSNKGAEDTEECCDSGTCGCGNKTS